VNNFSFLHYGPGGNAFVERQKLQGDFPEAQFLDQPHVKGSAHPFKTLVRACADHLLHYPRSPVVAHSFGCDLLMAAMGSQPLQNSPLVLVSPLKSIPQGMFNVAIDLEKRAPQPGLEKAIAAAEPALPDLDAEKFWGLVSQVAVHPDYGKTFWQSAGQMAEYYNTAASGPPFDATEWQAVIQDYLFANTPANFGLLKSKEAWVIFGDCDPYIELEKELPYWRSLVGSERVIVIKSSGHYPHLETRQEFLDILKRV
jgi:pimeloyl-ACP methyl ester carboxylesterase